ncbi:MAG: hypothetical protein JRI98_15385, partial [Deltaproteobacteria bacterium]|nr:hypothetical protein [Deltaproteobacteria bacterium]
MVEDTCLLEVAGVRVSRWKVQCSVLIDRKDSMGPRRDFPSQGSPRYSGLQVDDVPQSGRRVFGFLDHFGAKHGYQGELLVEAVDRRQDVVRALDPSWRFCVWQRAAVSRRSDQRELRNDQLPLAVIVDPLASTRPTASKREIPREPELLGRAGGGVEPLEKCRVPDRTNARVLTQ